MNRFSISLRHGCNLKVPILVKDNIPDVKCIFYSFKKIGCFPFCQEILLRDKKSIDMQGPT